MRFPARRCWRRRATKRGTYCSLTSLEVLRYVPLGLEEAFVPYELLHPVSEEVYGDPGHALSPDAELVVGPVVHQKALEVPRREDLIEEKSADANI